ncbi:hypothetical protein [uncultured Shewanella sp.]|uniref:DUF6998 domain-containing protein n=1 Tax=uncultured Shewanella sp. TaxID=173975 RepID=UPI00260EA78B|nr:hypothetical protein [uncultured Shewanella sp.]
MALTQIQVIQSLGEAMSWLERELNWGVPPTELRHLIGRIGELYAALITGGQMATEVNQAGYDVVGENGERISVKTTARMAGNGHILFNANTINLVDRVIILRVNTEEMQVETLFDGSVGEANHLMCPPVANGKLAISMSKLLSPKPIKRELSKVTEVTWKDYQLIELENGTIEVWHSGSLVSPSKPHLRSIAKVRFCLFLIATVTHTTQGS